MKYFTIERQPFSVPNSPEDEAVRLLKVRWKGKVLTGLNQSAYRSYVYPILTPAGVPVTTERSTDHVWHQSITIGTDYFFTYRQSSAGAIEEPALNFYWDRQLFGRDAGRIVSFTDDECTEFGERHLQITQRLQWQSPERWGVPPHRLILGEEMRTIDVYPGDVANIIDIRSRLRPTQWDIRIGPCRHGYFTIRVADHLRVTDKRGHKLGGTLTDSHNRMGADEINWQHAEWIDFSGSDPDGRPAGITLFQFPSVHNVPWYLVDYGSVRINPFRLDAFRLTRGTLLDLAIRVVAHDGNATDARVSNLSQSIPMNNYHLQG